MNKKGVKMVQKKEIIQASAALLAIILIVLAVQLFTPAKKVYVVSSSQNAQQETSSDFITGLAISETPVMKCFAMAEKTDNPEVEFRDCLHANA